MHNIIFATFTFLSIIFVFGLLVNVLTQTENTNKVLREGKAAKGIVLSKKEIYDSNVECNFWQYMIKVQPLGEPAYNTLYTDTSSIFPKNLVVRYFPETSGKIEPELLTLKEEGYYADDSKISDYISCININFQINSLGTSARAIIRKFTDLNIRVDKGNKIFAELDVRVLPKYLEPFDSKVKVVVKPSDSFMYKADKYIGIKYNPQDKSIAALNFDYRKKKSNLKLLISFLILTLLGFAYIVFKDISG